MLLNFIYKKVLDNEPIPGMIVSPRFGVIPVGGNAPIKIEMNPNDVVKFDARVLVQIRGSKTIELRLSGESEEPYIDISVVSGFYLKIKIKINPLYY